MKLKEIEVELDDDTLTINPTPGSVEFGIIEHTPDQPINTVSLVVDEAGAGDGSVTSDNY
jgi:hypothetical protein